MLKIKEKTIVEVNTNSILSDYGDILITKLYLPIIGCNAMSLYFFFVNQYKLKVYTFELSDILFSLKLSMNDYLKARNTLEAIGLIKTYENENKLLEVIYSPKSPSKFFDDIIFSGLLIKSVGKHKYNEIKQLFTNEINRDNCIDISSKFNNIFEIELDDSELDFDISNNQFLIKAKSKDSPLNFNYDIFLDFLNKKANIKKDIFNRNILKNIAKLASFYGFDELFMANLVLENFNYFEEDNNKKINLELLKQKCYEELIFDTVKKTKTKPTLIDSNTKLAKKINLMEKLTPFEYLKRKQNNIDPINSDMDILEELNNKLNLSNSIINALVDFTLEKTNGRLNKKYMLKVGTTLIRNNIENASQAMSFLYDTKKNNQNNNTKKDDKSTNNEKEYTEEESQAIIDEFFEDF